MDIQTAKAIPIDEFLQQLGCPVVKTTGGCKWYHAPTRVEKTPSFKLSPDAKAWFDHGTGEGGNILDLAYRLHSGVALPPQLERQHLQQALGFIHSVIGGIQAGSSGVPNQHPQSVAHQEPAFTVVEHTPFTVYDLNDTLTPAARYLTTRAINPQRIAPYLEDITFAGRDHTPYYGFGLPNLSGGYEIRRLGDWQKRSVGPKNVTIFQAQRPASPWHTFYSLIDFGTFLTVDQPPVGAYQYLILNSDSLVEKAITYLTGVPAGFMVHYPHGDPSGQQAYHKLADSLTRQGWTCHSKAYLYTGYKDWTEAREAQVGLSRAGTSSMVLKKTPKRD